MKMDHQWLGSGTKENWERNEDDYQGNYRRRLLTQPSPFTK